MSNSTLQLALEIALQTKNLKELDLLMDELKAAGVDVTHLTDESAKLAKQFGELEQKQALINQFRELKKATSEANTEWQAAQAATAAYTSQIQDAKASLEALEVAMRNQGAMSQEEARATQAEYNAMVREIRNLEQAQADQATRASQLSSQYNDLNSRLVATRSAMHDVGLSTTGLNAQQQALARESEQAQAALGELTAEAERLNAIAQARITLGIDTDDNARRQIEEVTAAYETLRDSGTLTAEELARANELHTQRVAELEVQLGETAPTLDDIATEFGKVTAAAGGLAYVTTQAMEFETAISGVKKVVDGTPQQLEELSSKIQQIAVDMGMSTTAIAEMAAQGGQLGVPIEKLSEFTELAGKMSVAFNMSAEDAGDAAAKIANVFGIPIEQVEKLGDAINTLGNTSAAKESEIVDVMQRIGGQAKQFGLATEQAAALGAAFISLGKSPEVAGTAINALLTKLQTANVQGDDFQQTLSNIGINANKLADDINANPQQALTNFLTTLSQMDSQQRSIATFKLFGQEYVDDVNALVGGLDTYNKALASVSTQSQTAGAMQKEFDAKMATSAQSVEQAKQSINVLAQTMGKELLPVVALGAKAVGGLAQGINDFAESHPILTKMAVLLAGAQVAMVAFNSAMTIAGALGLRNSAGIVSGFTAGAGSVNLATLAVDKLNAALGMTAVAAGRAATGLSAMSGTGRTITGDLKGMASQMMTLNGLFAAAAGWTIGTTIGKSLYDNSGNARAFGDELARVLAYLDAIVTDRTFEDVNKNFATSASQARLLAEAEKAHADSIEGKTEAILKSNDAQQQQIQTNQRVVDAISQTKDTIDSLNAQMTIMRDKGAENTAAYASLANSLQTNQEKLDTLTLAQEKSMSATEDQSISNLDLANSIKITTAQLQIMQERLAQMETDGLKGSAAYAELSDEIGKTQNKLDALKAEGEKKGIGELLKTDLEKASEAFKTLGLDAQEFATGVNSNTTAALNAFIEVAHLADGNINQLARAYNAASQAVGDNQLAQDELNKKLLQVTEGNQAFASAVQSTAQAQRAAKNATEEQQSALDKLGISMDAANQGMSKGGAEMVQTLRTGIDAIKEQATSANALKTSLQQAFDQSLTAAKTKEDFAGIKQAIEQTGVASQLTSEQAKVLSAGITGGADAAKQATVEIEKQTAAIEDNHSANQKWLQEWNNSHRRQRDAIKETAEADTQATQVQQQNSSSLMAWMQAVTNGIKGKISALQEYGATAEQVNTAFDSLSESYRARTYGDFRQWAAAMGDLDQVVKRSVDSFKQAATGAAVHAQMLSSTEVSANNLAEAELALYRAQQANINGIIRMDGATLDNLKRQIDSARERMQDLADAAKTTADNLEADLARIKGDDALAMQLEQTRKLQELQDKLADAQKRSNAEEVAQLQRALDLQRQINAEEARETDIKKQQEQQRKAEEAQKQSQPKPNPTSAPMPSSTPTQPSPTPSAPIQSQSSSDGNVYASAKLVAAEIARLKKEAIDEFMRVLQDEIKRQAR